MHVRQRQHLRLPRLHKRREKQGGGRLAVSTICGRPARTNRDMFEQHERWSRALLSEALCEPVFQRKVGDVLKMTGIMCHERRPMVFRNGGNQGVFFSGRSAHAQ